jgi:hypothetical protein
MTTRLLADSTRTVKLAVAPERVDVTEWLFTLRDDEYQQCSKAHIAGGASFTPDGRRMSINVEKPGDTLLIQHYVEDRVTRDFCRVVSDTDGFTPMGPARYEVIWEVSVSPDGPSACVFTNHVEVYATEGLVKLLQDHGISFEQARAAAQQTVDEHNTEEAPLFAKNIETKASKGIWGGPD